ncbi:hypothetical protein ACH4E7_45445 [Kitasatospora sp. NPDC018058]|uniref:hypothetical protein n=1 Tax=Kitasatospora sp. NPDC018058 TaxID=3364025 RepID=UPI0037BE778D
MAGAAGEDDGGRYLLPRLGIDAECERTLSIAWTAHRAATGEELPNDAFTIRYPELDPEWDFDFEDGDKLGRRLPRLADLYSE